MSVDMLLGNRRPALDTLTMTLRVLTPADLERAAEIQAQAFHDDPLWAYILPNVRQRERELIRTFRVFLGASIRRGQTYGVGEPLAGIAVWSAPNEGEGFGALVGAGFLRLLVSPFVLSFFKAGPVFGQFERMKKQYATDPHYYLNTIAVSPEAQGKGLASQLIRPFLDKADAEGVSAYTETMTPSNVGLYQHYGFEVVETYDFPKKGLRLWGFYRPRR